MAVRHTAGFGIYSDRPTTRIAIETLSAAGFRSTDISALFPDEVRTKDFAQRKQVKVPQVAAFALARVQNRTLDPNLTGNPLLRDSPDNRRLNIGAQQ